MESSNVHLQKKSALCLAIGLAISHSAWAEPDSQFEEVVVWGTKVSSDSESLIADDMALKQADHMSDILRDIPGVDVGGTHSVNQRINIRGLNETDLDIRLDGASQHANMFHHIGNLTLNPDILKSADIKVGNNSVTQGGLGGAVNFETKNAKDLLENDQEFGGRLFGGFADNNSRQTSLTLFGQLSDDVDAMVYGHQIQRNNFRDGEGEETFGTAGDVVNLLAKVGIEPADGHRIELAYDAYRDKGDYSPRPDMNGEANAGLSGDLLLPTQYDRDTVTLGYTLKTSSLKGKATLFNSKTFIERDESQTGWARFGRESINTATNSNTGGNVTLQSDIVIAGLKNQLTYGVDYLSKTSKSEFGDTEFMSESAKSAAAFVENTLHINKKWDFTAGLRFDDYRRNAMTGSHDFSDTTWSLGTEYAVTPEWTVFANTRTLFKGPELLETFIKYQDKTYLADDIKAETGQNTQGGVRFAKTVGEHSFSSNLTLFNTRINDHISEQWNGNGYLLKNTGDVEYKGAELSASYGYENVSAKLSYSKSDNKDLATGDAVTANGRSTDIGDSIALTVDYEAENIETLFGWTSVFVLDEKNVLAGKPIKEGYNVHNVYAQWMPSDIESLSVTLGIDNVLNETYVSHASRSGAARGFTTDDYEPGRNIKVSASYQF
ncbi:TonB-dependent siderophore receptor [Veronia nyctiphanis]|uniref:TonB-dependent siderophore receptor n=1 Tax=Veronia nyctiphanis TaxID=1278244 RepID=A0A4V1LSK1_9GAMM|nr:TonB-dependent siderophore receptor [Veronia nyctiphanis]RXJ71978.1 TonB-dependent siderophore receptor [Veronia nyctiphanis]